MAISFDIVLPFCPKDIELLQVMLSWMEHLGCPKVGNAVLIPSVNTPVEAIYRAFRSARERFEDVTVLVCELPDAPWPVGPNNLFAWAGQQLRRPFLWVEPDCVPLVPEWLQNLSEAYSARKAPIMADWYDKEHTSGIAVYAPPEARVLAISGDQSKAWDSREPELFRRMSFATPLIAHIWGQHGNPPRFLKGSNGEPATAPLAWVRPGASLFHRCKDGSLMRLYRPQFSPKPRTRRAALARCFVQLGRYGDIVNILPVLRDVARSGVKPTVVVSKEFADIFDGVSYARPLPVECGPFDLQQGIDTAKASFPEATVTQVYGTGFPTVFEADHFNRLQWHRAGYLHRWNDPTLRLEFDRRAFKRERKLVVEHVLSKRKPVVLLNLKGGHSSRTDEGAKAQEFIVGECSNRIDFVDISGLRCERLYDLAGLLELANGLVTVDTATLHLADVSDIPVVALLSDQGEWYRSAPRCRTHAAFPAGEWRRNIGEICAALSFMADHRPRVFLVCERHGDLNEREKRAQATWDATGWTRLTFDKYQRSARDIGDTRDLPYMKDALRLGLQHAGIHDLVAITNADIGFRPGLDAAVRSLMRGLTICTARRLETTPEGDVIRESAGRDLVVFRADWLSRNIDRFPDFLLGATQWDLWAMVEARVRVGNAQTDLNDLELNTPECEVFPVKLLHEYHKPVWNENIRSPSELHNRSLYAAFSNRLRT